MLRLLLLRHAEAGHPAGVSDRDRPLSAAGHEAAIRLGRYLAASGLAPAFALVSAARRTRETWELAAAALPPEIGSRNEARLYHASAATTMELIAGASAAHHALLLCGHNPGLHETAVMLARTGDRTARASLQHGLPPGGLVVMEFELEQWQDVPRAAGRLVGYETPASLARPGS